VGPDKSAVKKNKPLRPVAPQALRSAAREKVM
jgi:hypothetical protein